ncbi:uncharacterized protein LOC120653534 [Panicum virgatum]|uniref:uncharacterized protein LOC120653534 n=1 Tax=Panicum virgatum TaxID=38727 RepID=UPI0019D56258|nr:uncharacterized protein LOC120653534 [Panicum virgatum]
MPPPRVQTEGYCPGRYLAGAVQGSQDGGERHAARTAQIPAGGPQAVETTVTSYREALARGCEWSQAQMDTGDASQSSIVEAARSGVEGETGRGSEEHAARPDAGEDAGRGGAENATQLGAGDDTGRGSVDDATQPGAGGEETGGDASECPASQTGGEVPIPEPMVAGAEDAAAAAMAQTAPLVVPAEETPTEVMPEAAAPARLVDPWEVAAAAAVAGALLVMEMPAGDPREVATAAAGIASASEGGLGARPSEEPGHKDNLAMYKAWAENYKVNDEIYNALTLALDLYQGRSFQVSDKDKVLEAKEAELQGKEAAVTTLTETLMKKTSSSRHERWPFGTQRPPSKRRKPPSLRKAVADETAVKDALQVAYSSAQNNLLDLEGAAVAACQELEGEGGLSGSSVASHMRSLSGQVAERLKSAFRLGVQRALGVVSTHYVMDLEQVATGYVVTPGIEGDAAMAAMEQADAAVEGAASALSVLLDGDLLPYVEDDAAEGARDGEGDL